MTSLLGTGPFIIAGLFSAGFVFQKLGTNKDLRRYSPPGQFIETESGSFHMHVMAGPAGPSVVLESGLAGSSLSWALVQKEISQFASVCSYDRAGFGWSTPSRTPRTLATIVEELRQLLARAPLSPPYILVGHSYGGLIVRAFSHLYPDLTAGMVLVDPVSTQHWASCETPDRSRLKKGIRLARRGEFLARFGVIRLALDLLIVGRRIVPMTMARVTAPGAGNFLQRLAKEIQKLPAPLWPIVRAQWSRPMGFRTISDYLTELQQNCLEGEALLQQVAIPTVVLSAGTATAAEVIERSRWIAANEDAVHLPVPSSGHWIQIEEPAAVIDAVSRILGQTK